MHDVYCELRWRGLIHQTTDDANLGAWLMKEPRTVYVGFDPTADSLHVGHLMALMVLRRFQKAGHRPIALVGGATGLIGDPSGKSDERKLLSLDALRANVEAMGRQLRRFLDFDPGPQSALLVNNYDWNGRFSYLEFLRDVGKHFPINIMLSKDSVKSRLERLDSGLSYTEFSYMLLQAYDFVHLSDQYGCRLQAGGSDQWGNITAGIDLIRRVPLFATLSEDEFRRLEPMFQVKHFRKNQIIFLEEETGNWPKTLYSADIVESFYDPAHNCIHMVPVFVAELDASKWVVVSKEHSEFKWVTSAEAKDLVVFTQQRLSIDLVEREFILKKPPDELLIEF